VAGVPRSPHTELHRLRVHGLSRRYGPALALDAVDLSVSAGEVHALLGPNGAGKTTLLRIVSGLVEPSDGSVELYGDDGWIPGGWDRRALVGFVPSSDRSFYLRLTAPQNLTFFGRLHGLGRREARRRAQETLAMVGLEDAAGLRVGAYSHGMQKRLAVARALLVAPPLLLVDEATHDLDPEGARVVHRLVRRIADDGAAVIWTTQRIEEITGLADSVTVLREGKTAFAGSVEQLLTIAERTRYVVQVRDRAPEPRVLVEEVRRAVGETAAVEPLGARDPDHFRFVLRDGIPLGAVLAGLPGADIELIACREERSVIEDAFLSLTGGADR
jgi:ABC-2 type transport system ATP-binding protein